ncbi:hypothetical protein [Desulfitobacterium hafniense]|nr:hypothetical protein [Desulfitobacterium hafniense]
MKEKDLQETYIERLNTLLPTVDLRKLDQSCNSTKDEYAKAMLKQMHDMFVEVYGTDYLEVGGYGFVELPAVIQARNTGHIGLGIVTLDLESSGEHGGTFFLTPLGVIDQEKRTPAQAKYLSTVYIPYDYWYTVSLERDHHVDFDNVPEKVADLLRTCHGGQPEMKDSLTRADEQGKASIWEPEQPNGPVMK